MELIGIIKAYETFKSHGLVLPLLDFSDKESTQLGLLDKRVVRNNGKKQGLKRNRYLVLHRLKEIRKTQSTMTHCFMGIR